MAGVRKERGRGLGRETTPPRVSLAPKTPFPIPFKRLPRRLSRKRSRKSVYDLVTIKSYADGILVRTFPFLPTPLTSVAYVPLMINRKQKRKDKPITMHVHTLCGWFSSSASTSDNLVFNRS